MKRAQAETILEAAQQGKYDRPVDMIKHARRIDIPIHDLFQLNALLIANNFYNKQVRKVS